MKTNLSQSQPSIPLVVDLDGTLVKTDLLFESATHFIARQPFQLFYLLLWLIKGKAHLKAQLAQRYSMDAKVFPYNSDLILWLTKEHQLGRTLILATASHKLLAVQVADHLGIFDKVLATEESLNLKSCSKRDLLVNMYGEDGFDYIGNDLSDIPIWKASNFSYIVSSSPSLINRVQAIGNLSKVFSSNQPSLIYSLFKSLRPHQWVKNILVFIPLLASHQLGELTSVYTSSVAFLVFSMAASSVYVLNDLIDISDDRQHHHKKTRPFAAGSLSLLLGWILWPLLLIGAYIISTLVMPKNFIAVLSFYFILTLFYSLKFKKIAILDVLILSGLYTLRILAGGEAIGAPLSFWLLNFSMFIFFSLALIKRFSELSIARGKNNNQQVRGRGYIPSDLELVSSIGIGSGLLSILVLALYVQDSRAAALYSRPELIWLVCPVLLFWICRVWLIAHRGDMNDDPIMFALKDKVSLLVGCSLALIYIVATVKI